MEEIIAYRKQTKIHINRITKKRLLRKEGIKESFKKVKEKGGAHSNKFRVRICKGCTKTSGNFEPRVWQSTGKWECVL